MTQEDKSLLLKDLCARLPYGVKMIDTEPYSTEHNPILTLSYISEDNGIGCRAGKGVMATSLGSIKPYLFPLSSMTEEQKKEISKRYKLHTYYGLCIEIANHSEGYWDDDNSCNLQDYLWLVDWLNKNHFDYRGLIEKGLAIDATGLNIY